MEFDVEEFLYLRDVEHRSLRFIADMLGFETWRKLQYALKKNKIEYEFKKAVGGSPDRYCKLNRIAHEHGYNDFDHLVAEHRPTMSIKEIAEYYGVSLNSVNNHISDGIKGQYRHFTDEAKEMQLQALARGREKIRIQEFNGEHIWQRHNKTSGREISINNFNKAKVKIMDAIEEAKKLEAQYPKGSGAIYTPKPLDPATGTGGFMQQTVDDLNKAGLQNPPFGAEEESE